MFLNWGKNEGSKFIGQAGSEGSAVLTSIGGVNGRVASEQSCAVAHGSTNVICKGPDCKYCRLCWPCGLCGKCSTRLL